MGTKKKFHGGFVLLFGVLCCLFVGFSSTACYASTSLSDEQYEYIVEQGLTYDIVNGIMPNLTFSNKNYYPNVNKQTLLSLFKTSFETYNDLDFATNGNDLFGYWGIYGDGELYYLRFYYTKVNYGKYDGFNHVYIYFNPNISLPTNTFEIAINYINDNKQVQQVEQRCFEFTFKVSNNNYALARFYNPTTSASLQTSGYRFINPTTSWNTENFNTSKLACIRGIISFSNTNSVYTNFDGSAFYNEPINKLLQTNYSGGGNNPTPNPDIPEDTGNTGTITDNNGDTTGQIDLSGIQNSLGNIDQTTTQIESNTQTIIEQQQQNAEQLHNDLTDVPDMSEEEITSGDFEDIVDFSPINDSQEYTAISNLWYELLNGFSNSLTNVNRTLYIEFRGENYAINLDDFSVFIPNSLKVFFATLCTVFVVIYIAKNIKHLVEDIQTASIDNVANKLTEDFETNMF